MAKGLDQVGDMQAEQPDERGVLVLRINGNALVDGIANRQVSISGIGIGHAPTGGDRDPLYGDLLAFDRHVDAPGLCPGARECFRGASRVVTALGLRDRERGQIGFACDPVREVASGEALDPGLLAAIEIDHLVAEMGENGEVKISFEISAGDEPPEQARQRDLHFARLAQRLPEEEGCARAGRGEESIQDRPGAIGCARRLEHFADAGVFDVGDVQRDGRARERVQ